MSRRSSRRELVLGIDLLEGRQMLSGISFASGSAQVEPSADAQYMLELVNEARTNPSKSVDRLLSSPDADLKETISYYKMNLDAEKQAIRGIRSQQPLAWNPKLSQAAAEHSADMANNNYQDHRDTKGRMPSQRLEDFGYNNQTMERENAFAYAESVDRAMQAFLVDWGTTGSPHRLSMLQSGTDPNSEQAASEVGIGLEKAGPGSKMGPLVVTQNFSRQRDSKPFLLGVAYRDNDKDNFYTPGEGVGGVTLTAVNVKTGGSQSVQSWKAGGYQLQLDPGDYELTATLNGQTIRSQRVTVGSQNVKVDYDLNQPWQPASAPKAAVAAVVSPQTPAPEPAPAPKPAAPEAKPEPKSEPKSEPANDSSWIDQGASLFRATADSTPAATASTPASNSSSASSTPVAATSSSSSSASDDDIVSKFSSAFEGLSWRSFRRS
jgi:hypothetical protein